MAGVSECFSIGSIVACTTCFKQNIEGEVMAFDPSTKMLILKCSRNNTSDVFVVNLGLCSDVQVKMESTSASEAPRSLNLQRLSTRVRNTVEQKKRWVAAMAAGVSPDGQRLYMDIAKTIKEVTWKDANIIVFNDVIIKPPYRVENVTGDPNSRQFTYVKKIVERCTRHLPADALVQPQPAPVAVAAAPTPTSPQTMVPPATKSTIIMPNQAPLPQRKHHHPTPTGNGHYPAKHSTMSNIRAN